MPSLSDFVRYYKTCFFFPSQTLNFQIQHQQIQNLFFEHLHEFDSNSLISSLFLNHLIQILLFFVMYRYVDLQNERGGPIPYIMLPRDDCTLHHSSTTKGGRNPLYCILRFFFPIFQHKIGILLLYGKYLHLFAISMARSTIAFCMSSQLKVGVNSPNL